MRVSRRRGQLRLRLLAPEAEALGQLFDELDSLIADPQPEDPVVQRLYPAAYRDDEAAEREYRELTETSLREEQSERLAACRADLASGTEIGLDAEAGTRWIQALNDLRLAVGTRLGVTEDDVPSGEHESRMIYYWLTHLQDDIVQALMHR